MVRNKRLTTTTTTTTSQRASDVIGHSKQTFGIQRCEAATRDASIVTIVSPSSAMYRYLLAPAINGPTIQCSCRISHLRRQMSLRQTDEQDRAAARLAKNRFTNMVGGTASLVLVSSRLRGQRGARRTASARHPVRPGAAVASIV